MSRFSLQVPAVLLLTLFAAACGKGTGNSDGSTEKDMRTKGEVCDAAIGKVGDFAAGSTGRVIAAGDFGSPCTANANCKHGPTPTCWIKNLLNDANALPVTGGYCSSGCTVDADCADSNMDPNNPNLCVNFGTTQAPQRACIAGCGDAVTCRHPMNADGGGLPGYSCTLLSQDAMGNPLAGCFPSGTGTFLTCNPKEAACTTLNNLPGGCWRQAIEDEDGGICLATCVVGNECAMDVLGNTDTCLEVNFTGDGDGFRGSLCFPQAATPAAAGAACMYADDCIDTYQCDNTTGGTQKCQQLCQLGMPEPKCPTGTTCQDAFGICAGPGLCR
jgi:hypothetical protein